MNYLFIIDANAPFIYIYIYIYIYICGTYTLYLHSLKEKFTCCYVRRSESLQFLTTQTRDLIKNGYIQIGVRIIRNSDST